MTLTCLILMATFPALVTADTATNDVGSVAVTVSGAEVQAMVTEDGRDVTLSIGGEGAVRVGLPESESVSEIRIGAWMKTGIALAVETRNSKSNEVSYYWSTVWVNPKASEIGTPVLGRFLKSKIDYDVVGVVNSQSDSICITLLRHQCANDSQSCDGHLYVNNCPVGPDVKGVLLPLAVGSEVAEGER